MSRGEITKAVTVDLCDLCGKEIPKCEPGEFGSILGGWIFEPVTPRTKHAWLRWPPHGRERAATWRQRQESDLRQRTYDFHADCILALVEGAIAEREDER